MQGVWEKNLAEKTASGQHVAGSGAQDATNGYPCVEVSRPVTAAVLKSAHCRPTEYVRSAFPNTNSTERSASQRQVSKNLEAVAVALEKLEVAHETGIYRQQ